MGVLDQNLIFFYFTLHFQINGASHPIIVIYHHRYWLPTYWPNIFISFSIFHSSISYSPPLSYLFNINFDNNYCLWIIDSRLHIIICPNQLSILLAIGLESWADRPIGEAWFSRWALVYILVNEAHCHITTVMMNSILNSILNLAIWIFFFSIDTGIVRVCIWKHFGTVTLFIFCLIT